MRHLTRPRSQIDDFLAINKNGTGDRPVETNFHIPAKMNIYVTSEPAQKLETVISNIKNFYIFDVQNFI